MSSRPMKENRPSKAQAVLALAGTGLCLGAILCMSGDDAWENAGKNARLSLGSMLGLTPKSKKAKKSKYKSKTKAESTATMAKHVLEKKKKKKKKKTTTTTTTTTTIKKAVEAQVEDEAPDATTEPTRPPQSLHIGGIGTRTTMGVEAPLMDALSWSTEDQDETSEPVHPCFVLPPVERGFKRIFCRKATVTVPGFEPFILDSMGIDDADGCVMPKIRVVAGEENGEVTLDEYVVAVQEMYYDEPLDDANANADVDLKLVFTYMYTRAMLVELQDAPLSTADLDGLHPAFDHERELAEAVSFEQELTSVDMVRGCVRVAWCSDDTRADYFCTRELDDDHIRMSERAIIAQLRSEAYSRLQSVVGES